MVPSNTTKALEMFRFAPIIVCALFMAGACLDAAKAQQRDTPFRIQPQIVITPSPNPSPYVGFETREVKTLSTEKQEGLKRGASLNYALAAEMNGYPSPLHVLELADQLGLDADQKKRAQVIFDKLRRDAVTSGEALIAAEAHLDRIFELKQASYDRVDAQTAVIAAQEARLRAVHLNAHISMNEVLSPEQRESYDRLRGYGRALDEKPDAQKPEHSGHGSAPKPK
jgi:Spy/CpxP family protein refolding chaperone